MIIPLLPVILLILVIVWKKSGSRNLRARVWTTILAGSTLVALAQALTFSLIARKLTGMGSTQTELHRQQADHGYWFCIAIATLSLGFTALVWVRGRKAASMGGHGRGEAT